MRKAPWSKWRNLDRPNLRNFTVQMDDGPMDHLSDVNLDRPFGRWSNGPPVRRNFGPSKTTVVDRNFGPSKSTVVERNFGPSKITVVDRNFGPSKSKVVERNFGPSKITVVNRNFGSSKIMFPDHNFGQFYFFLGGGLVQMDNIYSSIWTSV